MRRLGDLLFRLRAVLRPRSMERELRDEFAFHVEMETRKLVSQGMDPSAAARVAAGRFGTMAAQREATRDSWGVGVVSDFIADLRHAFRQFRRQPGFSVLGISTLALGLGTTVALGGVARSILLRPLPVSEEKDLRVFWSDYNWRGVEYDYVAERTRLFSGLAAYSSDGVTLRTDAASSVLLTGVTSANLFDVLGSRPLMGRTFAAGEDRPGAAPVVVVSWGMWRQELGGDPAIVGRRIVLDGTPTTVIGVMPRGFYFPTPEFRLWRPLLLDPASRSYQGNGWLVLLGRVRPGTSEAAVGGEIQRLGTSLGERFTYSAAWDKTKHPSSKPLKEYLVGGTKPALLLLLGAGVLLLLIACANVAALVLARTTDRTHEIALRAALGAGRGRLARQIVTESLAFSMLSGVGGLGIAFLGFKLLVASLPLQNGIGSAVSLDWAVFPGALLLSLLVGLGVAAAPVRNLLRGQLKGVRNERGARGLVQHTGRVHTALVGGEAAVAVLLIVGAMLLIRSVDRLLAVDLGFEPHGVVAVDVYAGGSDLSPADRWRLFRELPLRAAQIPGVSSASLITRLPIRDGGWQGTVDIEGKPELSGIRGPNSFYRVVTPEYFETMGLRIVRGRNLNATDRAGTPHVGLVSESFAARAWPGEDPIGRRLHNGMGGDTLAVTVVGVVEEAKMRQIAGENPFVLYVPLEQSAFVGEGQTLVIRSTLPLDDVASQVRHIVHEIEPRAALARTTTMDLVVSNALAEPLRLRFFFSLFGAMALVLGVAGVYSVVSYSVARRQTEFGLRMALGATPRQVLRQVVGRGLLPVAAGTIAGLGAAMLLARGATRFLYNVGPADPASSAVAALALLGGGLLAAIVPAWRAARVSPVESLRAD